jgi:hypothetical protein
MSRFWDVEYSGESTNRPCPCICFCSFGLSFPKGICFRLCSCHSAHPLSLTNHLKRIPIRIQNIRSIVPRVVLQPSPRRNMIRSPSRHSCLIKRIHQSIALRLNSPMNRPRIRRPLLQPKTSPLPIPKPPKIRMPILPLIRQKERNPQRLQSRLIKSQRTLNIKNTQNNVIQHPNLPLKTQNQTAHSIFPDERANKRDWGQLKWVPILQAISPLEGWDQQMRVGITTTGAHVPTLGRGIFVRKHEPPSHLYCWLSFPKGICFCLCRCFSLTTKH